jgi:hypothetical protein
VQQTLLVEPQEQLAAGQEEMEVAPLLMEVQEQEEVGEAHL